MYLIKKTQYHIKCYLAFYIIIQYGWKLYIQDEQENAAFNERNHYVNQYETQYIHPLHKHMDIMLV
jgi:hypothetical protein